MVEILALLNGVTIATAASVATRQLGEMTKGAIRDAIKKKLAGYWQAYRSQGKEFIHQDLKRALRESYLKSVSAVATDCEIRYSLDVLNEVPTWTAAIRHAVDAEFEGMKKSDYTVPQTVMLANIGAISQPFYAELEIGDLEAALLEELSREFMVAREPEFSGGTVFMEMLHREIREKGLLGSGCPPRLWAMFANGWPCGSQHSLAENPGSLSNRGGLLRWVDLLSAYFADSLRQNSQTRIAFEHQVLCHVALREESIPAEIVDQALNQIAMPLRVQIEELRALAHRLLLNSEDAQRSLSDLKRRSSEEATKQSDQFEAILKNSEQLGNIQEILGGMKVEAVDSVRALRDGLIERDHRIEALIVRLLAQAPAEISGSKEVDVSSQEEPILQGYLEWVIREFRYLPNGLQLNRETIPLPLDRVYVSVRGYPGAVTELQQGHSRKGSRAPSTLRERDQRKQFAAEPAASINLAEAFRDQPAMVILGDPGSGKSTLSRWIALNFARSMQQPQPAEVLVSLASVNSSAEGESARVSLGESRLPIILRIDDLARELRGGGNKPLAELLACGEFKSCPLFPEGHPQSGKPIDRGLLRDLFLRYIQAQKAVVLLDGLDEVGTLEERKEIVGKIHDFIDLFYGSRRGNHLVVTSRVVGYEANPLRNTVARYTIESMDPDAIRVFSQSWHTGWSEALHDFTPERRREMASRASQSLVDQIFADDARSLRQLASNPLMLSLLCALNLEGGEKLPESRTELYSALVRRELYESWLGRHPGRGRLRDVVIRLLAFVAEAIHRTSVSNLIGRSELETKIAEIVARDPAFAFVAASADELTAGVTDGAGLLVERGFQQYAFRHQTIQEYLAAVALVDNAATAAARMWEHCGDSRWHEVLLFAMGILAPLDQGAKLKAVCLELLEKEDTTPERYPGVTLLLANAMGQIPEFPLDIATEVLNRLFLRYSQLSVNLRQTSFCETVEEIFGREAKYRERNTRGAASLSLLRKYAASQSLEDRQAVAGIATSQAIADPVLMELLARAARQDRGHGHWRIRRFLVASLSRAMNGFPPNAEVDAQICSVLDPAALAVLRDPTKIHASRYLAAPHGAVSEQPTLREDLFPLRRSLQDDAGMLEFLSGSSSRIEDDAGLKTHPRDSSAWIKVVIALQGGLCHLGLDEVEQVFLRERAVCNSIRAASSSAGTTAAHLDCDTQPRLELLRWTPLSLDPALIWRGSPLSRWIAEQLEARLKESELVERLLELWDDPDSAQSFIDEFAWNWHLAESAVRDLFLTDVLLALAVLGCQPEGPPASESRPAIYEEFRRECEWLEAYLKEPAYRAMIGLEKWLDRAEVFSAIPQLAEKPPSSTAKAVETAFRDELWPESADLPDQVAMALWRAFSTGGIAPEDEGYLVENVTAPALLKALAVLAVPPSVPWMKEENVAWVFPCLMQDQPSTFIVTVLLGIGRIPQTFDRLRSYALRAVGHLGDYRQRLLPWAIQLTGDWEASGELFRSALEPWLAGDLPDTDDKWKAVRDRKRMGADLSDAVLSFWILRQLEPKENFARRQWITSLYEFARRIEHPTARLGAELHLFTICDADETMLQWRRLMRLSESLEDAGSRQRWMSRLSELKNLAVVRHWLIASESGKGGSLLGIVGLSALAGNRPIKAVTPLAKFDEDRPYALAMYWSHLLSDNGDDPIYSISVVLDTLGKTLGASLDDLLRSLVLLETWIGLPHFQEWPVMPILDSEECRRDLLFTALMVLFRIPHNYQMMVEWVLRRMLPYLFRLDREFLPLAIAVTSRLRDVHRIGLLRLLCPGSEGDVEAALTAAWKGLDSISDPYLRWRTEWVLSRVSARRRPMAAMLEDIHAFEQASERYVCLALLLLEGNSRLIASESWQRLLKGLPDESLRTLQELLTSNAKQAESVATFPSASAEMNAVLESSLSWVEQWKNGERSSAEVIAANVLDLQLRVLHLNRSGQGSADAEFWARVAEGKPIEDSLLVADPVTGLRWAPLRGEAVEILRRALPAELGPEVPCPTYLQFIRGTTPEAIPFLYTLANGRRDICGDWAALMLAESSSWTRQVVVRVRKLLKSGDNVLRNRAMFAMARGGDWRDASDEPYLLSAARVGREVIDEMMATLANAGMFHPVVDMTLIFAMDRVVFDDPEHIRSWLAEAAQPGKTQKRAKATLEHISRASIGVCRILAANLSANQDSAVPGVQEALIQSAIYLWERENWRTDVTLWAAIRKALLDIGGSEDEANAPKALEALGYIGLGDHGGEMMALAARGDARKAAALRAFGISAEQGYNLKAAEKAFLSESLGAEHPTVAVASAEASLRSGTPMLVLESIVAPGRILSALVGRLDSFFIGEPFVRKVREAGLWLNELTHAERYQGKSVEETVFAELLREIARTSARQSFASPKQYPAHERLSNMLAIAASAAELMPETCETLLDQFASTLVEQLESVVLRHGSYVARQAALVLLSYRRSFSEAFAKALASALGDLSMLQATAIECVSRIEEVDAGGLQELERLLASKDALIALAAARVVQGVIASSDLQPEMRIQFEKSMTESLHCALSMPAVEPRVAFVIESSLAQWSYRPLFLGVVKDAQEDAFFALRYPSSNRATRKKETLSEHVELDIGIVRRKEVVNATLTLGPNTAKSKHPAMHQSAWRSSAYGDTIPPEIMDALEKVQQVNLELRVSFAKTLHLATQSRFTATE